MATDPLGLPRHVDDSELAFLREFLVFQDSAARVDADTLRRHLGTILSTASSDAGAHLYRCVRTLMFLKPRVVELPSYRNILRERRPGDTWIDLGCGLATDVRRLLLDGWPATNILAIDVTSELWALGLRLFQDATSPPCSFIERDVSATDFVESLPSHIAGKSRAAQVVSLFAVLHVLDEASVEATLRSARRLLAPGGVLVGTSGGALEPGPWVPEAGLSADSTSRSRFLHSPASLATLLSRLGFERVDVGVVDPSSRGGSHAPPASVASWLYMRFEAWLPVQAASMPEGSP